MVDPYQFAVGAVVAGVYQFEFRAPRKRKQSHLEPRRRVSVSIQYTR